MGRAMDQAMGHWARPWAIGRTMGQAMGQAMGPWLGHGPGHGPLQKTSIFLWFFLVFYAPAARRQLRRHLAGSSGGNAPATGRDAQLGPGGRPTQQEPFAGRSREKYIGSFCPACGPCAYDLFNWVW